MRVNGHVFAYACPPADENKACNSGVRANYHIVAHDGIGQSNDEITEPGIRPKRYIVLEKASHTHLRSLGTVHFWQEVHELRTLLQQGLRKSTAFQRIA